MNSISCARAIQQPVNKLGSGFMMDGATFARATELGLDPGLGFYVLGRFGALGPVHADVVAASAVFFERETLTGYWTAACDAADPNAAATLFFDAADQWGRQHLGGAPALGRLNELASRVVDAASPVGAALFAALRALPRSSDPGGLAAQLSFMLRELRMSRHAVAVMAEQLSPVEAILSGGGGEANAKMFGWAEPFPDVSALRHRRERAEQLTDELHAADLDALSDTERDELADAFAQALAALR